MEATGNKKLSEKAQRVLEAASRVFLVHGFSAATTDMIQSEAGVSKSTVYAHFPSKEALFAAVIEFECDAFARQIRDLNIDDGHIKAVLTALGQAYLEIVFSPKALALFRVVVGEAPRFPDIAQVFYRVGPMVVGRLMAEHLQAAVAEGTLNLAGTTVDGAAQYFAGVLRAPGHLECLLLPNAQPTSQQIDIWVKQAVTIFLKAFATKAVSLSC